jgi:hypothetical protein
MEHTSAWETFREQADEAVPHIREHVRQLGADAYTLDFAFWRTEDDKRFTELLKGDWVSASKEVAQAMARVNADWLATGRQVAQLMVKADQGDARAQRELADVLKQREELARERSRLESRQNNVNRAETAGQKAFQGVRDVKYNEESRFAREDFLKLASEDAKLAKSALSGYIKTLEGGLDRLAIKAKQAEEALQYESAAAFEEKAKAIAETLADLRGLDGQIQEKNFVTGEFNAKAMEAMMRGGDHAKDKIQRDQLMTLVDMLGRLDKLIAKTGYPSIYAVE